MKTAHTCIIGDSRKMEEVKDASVHLVVTSPPYWQLKDYGSDNQIGFDQTYEEYINNLNLVWNECYRVLHSGCRLVINIGDQFARAVYYGRYKVIPIRTEIIKFCETVGFDYMGAIIWQKKTTMNTTGGATVMGSYPYPRNGIVEIDYEFVLVFKKPGTSPKVDDERRKLSQISKEKWKEYFSGHWYFNGVRQDGHIAMFPVELPKRVIEMFTFIGETVLDPFLGSGTTSVAALLMQRNSIGYEINKEFVPIITQKIGETESTLFTPFDFEVKYQQMRFVKWKDEVNKLKYVFKECIPINKKVDPRKMKFVSIVSVEDGKSGVHREDYYIVNEIIDTNIIKLSNDVEVRLLGVKQKKENFQEAKRFLTDKILKRQIFLRYDAVKHDSNDRLLAYVYMKNKTFVNAHLIKGGFAEIDTEFPFRYKSKFEGLIV